jgi:TolA-binding protein
MLKIIIMFSLSVAASGCLIKTRSQLAESEQNAVYSQRLADNQAQAQSSSAGSSPPVDVSARIPDERDETIRQLNGRIEVLENNLETLQKKIETEKNDNEQKLLTLQEALKKIEMQMNPEDGNSQNTAGDKSNSDGEPVFQSSDEIEAKVNTENNGSVTIVAGKKLSKNEKSKKKKSTYETAQDLFESKKWKDAIVNFSAYTDESPKGKLVPDAKYKIGLCFQELSMKDEAMAYFEEVAANYPNTEAGKKSKARLAKLKK